MSRSLPPRPNLNHLKSEAKALVKARGAGETAAAQTLKVLPRFARGNTKEILSARVSLQEAQHAIAMKYGFRDWAEMKKIIQRPDAKKESNAVVRANGTVWIEGVPTERPLKTAWHFDGCLSALRSMLKFHGTEDIYLKDDVLAPLSGQPYRFWFDGHWASCLAYTHEAPLCTILADILGFKYVWHPGLIRGAKTDRKSYSSKNAEMAWEKMIDNIDKGYPVLQFGGDPGGDVKAPPVVVTGYDKERGMIFYLPHALWVPAPKWDSNNINCQQGLEKQGYFGRPKPTARTWVGSGFADGQGMGDATICFFVLQNRRRRPPEREVALSALRRIVGLCSGKLIDKTRPWRKGGLNALNLFKECLQQPGEEYAFGKLRMPWNKIGDTDWWYAMEGLAYPPHRRVGAKFIAKCADGFGGFPRSSADLLHEAARHYDKSARGFAQLWKHFEAVGPLEEYEDHVNTVNGAFSSHEFRKDAAHIVGTIIEAEERGIAALQNVLKIDAA